jgi:hypothetical protein
MKKYIFHLKNFIINFSSEFARMKLLNYFETIKLMNYFFQGKKNHRFWYIISFL